MNFFVCMINFFFYDQLIQIINMNRKCSLKEIGHMSIMKEKVVMTWRKMREMTESYRHRSS